MQGARVWSLVGNSDPPCYMAWLKYRKKKNLRKNSQHHQFPGGPVVRTWRFHCWGPKFDPWLGKWDPAKNKQKKLTSPAIWITQTETITHRQEKDLSMPSGGALGDSEALTLLVGRWLFHPLWKPASHSPVIPGAGHTVYNPVLCEGLEIWAPLPSWQVRLPQFHCPSPGHSASSTTAPWRGVLSATW